MIIMSNYRRWLLVLIVMVATIGQVQADGKPWVINQRMLPAPAGASDTLKAAITNTPQPNVAERIQQTPKTTEQWTALIRLADSDNIKKAESLIEQGKVSVKKSVIAGVTVRTVTPVVIDPANEKRLFIHVHGGAYVFNGGLAGLKEAIFIAINAKIPVVSIDYRMPPANPFPAAIDDVVAVWKSLTSERPAKSMALGGTSAGGGLALASIHRFRELGLDTPGAVWAGTPWADLTKTGDSLYTNEGIDRVLVSYEGVLEDAAKLYANGRALNMPLISPMYGDFKGFPPTYLVTGTRDLFLSDTARVHRKMRVAGVLAELNVYEGASHGDYMVESPELLQAYGELGEFLLRHLK